MSVKSTENGAAQDEAAAAENVVFQPLVIRRLVRRTIEIPIVGVTPLIPSAWSVKARRMLPGGPDHGQKTTGKHDPEKEAHEATYWLPDGRPGMPSVAFKAAIADAARYFDKSIAATHLKQILFVTGEGPDQLVPIEGEAEVFEAMPRNSGPGSNAMLRYRNKFWPWSALLEIDYIESQITPESLANLVDAAGNGGVGDWRPSSPKSKTGTYGQFRVEE